MIVGLDDTDSRTQGMCTTYLATLIMEALSKYSEVHECVLYRLNPNAPHKTRGNACLALHLETHDPERVVDDVESYVEEYAVFDDPETNPGAAFYTGSRVPDEVRDYALETVRGVKTRGEAEEVAGKHSIDTVGWKNGRGVIGAVAAIGGRSALEYFGDQTWELIGYRERDRWGEPRDVEPGSFYTADEETYPETWDTVDRSNGVVTAVPNTPGPVLYGLRGSLRGVWRANSFVEARPDHVCVFRTNQGTDMHFLDRKASRVEEMRSYRVEGRVSSPPRNREGGHVFFSVDGLRCAAFEPTKGFRDAVRELRVGDKVIVCGSVKRDTLNVEKLCVESLNTTREKNPVCGCGKSMESAGRGQGYRCRDCGEERGSKAVVEVERDLCRGWYEVPPSARRHLAKPLARSCGDRQPIRD